MKHDWLSDLPWLKERLIELRQPLENRADWRLRMGARKTVAALFEQRIKELEAIK